MKTRGGVRGFWNDEFGLTLTEGVAVVVMGTWFIVTVWMLCYMVTGNLTDRMVDFYSVFTWTPLGVIGGLFGQAAFGALAGRSNGPTDLSQAPGGGGRYPKDPSLQGSEPWGHTGSNETRI
ncbi:MAG: hypothetical protein U1D96_05485 [Eubacteriales bacterium]|nr:hypothetical protein [Eubacteriales bacterium]